MKLAVFNDHGIGRFFAQMFDEVPEATLYLSERNKSGMSVTSRPTHLLSDKRHALRVLRSPLRAWRRHRENDFDRKRDFYFLELEEAALAGEFDVALTGAERSLYTLASLKAKGARFKLAFWTPYTIPFVDMFAERSLLVRQFAFPHVDRFIAITQTCAETLKLEGVAPERIGHVYPGVDQRIFRPAQPRPVDAEFHVLFVGKLASWKGCYTLLYALKVLIPDIPGIRLTLVGQGAQRQNLELAASLLGIAERIRFLGFVEYGNIAAQYAQADVFVLPSLPAINLAEQFGYVVAEAMSCGLPAVVASVGGLPEVVGKRAELLFPAGDYQSLASRLRQLHREPELRRELANHCLQLARERYDARRNGQALREELRALAAS